MLRSARFLGLGSVVAMLLASPRAHAQTVTLPGYPNRTVGSAPAASRVQNLNPLGINFDDCMKDTTLQFTLLLSNFDGSQLVQVWAGTSDCSSDASRGFQSVPSCWLVGQPIAGRIAGAAAPLTVPVRVQDIVGHQNSVPNPPSYIPVGAAACRTQAVDTAQSFNVWFIPTDSAGHGVGTAYKYPIKSDLVGPPPPSGVSIADGDTLFVVNWVANNDADTAGYNVYIDPIPGQEGATTGAPGAEPVLVCSDTGAPAASSGVMADSGTDASIMDATADTVGDASIADATADAPAVSDSSAPTGPICFYQGSAAPGSGNCGSSVLSGSTSTILDGSASVTSQVDEAGNLIEGGTTSGVGGISNISSAYLVNAGPSGVTASDRATGNYTISGLQNGTTYNVVVAAVDGFGNVGPPSEQKCDFPAPVNDFWSLYRADGGHAGGGLCALEAVGEPARSTTGIALGIAACALMIRRRRKTL